MDANTEQVVSGETQTGLFGEPVVRKKVKKPFHISPSDSQSLRAGSETVKTPRTIRRYDTDPVTSRMYVTRDFQVITITAPDGAHSYPDTFRVLPGNVEGWEPGEYHRLTRELYHRMQRQLDALDPKAMEDDHRERAEAKWADVFQFAIANGLAT